MRGSARPVGYTARTIAALTSNPGCARRALMDASGTDKKKVAEHMGFPAPFGQSPIALARGNAFEAQLKASGAAGLLRLLREKLDLTIPEVSYIPLENVGENTSHPVRYTRTRQQLLHAARRDRDQAATM